MSIDQRQWKSAFGLASASATATFDAAVLVGSTIIVVTSSQIQVASVTDNKGNSYAVDARATVQGEQLGIFRAYATTGGSGFAVTAVTAQPAPITMSIQEVPNVLIVDQTNAGTLIGSLLTITLQGRSSQVQSVYAACAYYVTFVSTQTTSSHGFLGQSPWRSLASGFLPNGIIGTEDGSFSWSSTSGQLVASAGVLSGTAVDFTTLCMVTYVEAVTADFTGTPVTGAAPLSVTFTDASTGSPTQWLWEFGDGQTDNTQSPVHSYAQAGTYSVRLTAWNFQSTSQRSRASYITAGSGGGTGGLPTPPGIPNADPSIANRTPFSFPPIPGSPWASSFSRFHTDPPAPTSSPAVTKPGNLIPTAQGNDVGRVQRMGRIVSSVLNSLERGKLSPRQDENEFLILGEGFEATRAPTVDDDETQGVFFGCWWVQTASDGTKTAFLCFDPTIGTADWRQVGSNATQGVSGLSGTFP